MKNLTFYICSIIHKYTIDQNSTYSQDKNSFIQGKPIKASHRRLALEGSRLQEKLEGPIAARFSTCACSLTHTTTVCRYQEGVSSVWAERSLPGVTRNTREIIQNYIVTFKFINISIQWLLASFFLFPKLKSFQPFLDMPYPSCYSFFDQLHWAKVLKVKLWNNTALLEYSWPPVPASHAQILLNSDKLSPN